MNCRKICILLLFVFVGTLNAQNPNLPNLYKSLSASKEDSIRVNILNDLAWEYMSDNMDSSIAIGDRAAVLSGKIGWEKGIAQSWHQMGIFYYYKSEFHTALRYYFKALKVWESIKDEEGQAKTFGNIGTSYVQLGDFTHSLEYTLKALKLNEKTGNKAGVASHYGNVGAIYAQQYDYKEALAYFEKALKLNRELNRGEGVQSALANIGTLYMQMRRSDEALQYLSEAKKMAEEQGNEDAVGSALGNMGIVYHNQKKNKEARDAYERSLLSSEKRQNDFGMLPNLVHLGELLIEEKDYAGAEKYLLKALRMSEGMAALNWQKGSNQALSKLYAAKGDFKKSLDYFAKFSEVKDSLFNEEKHKELTRKTMNFEFEKKEAIQKLEQDQKDAIAMENQKEQQLVLYLVSGGLFLMMIAALIIYRGYRQKQKANGIILAQKKEVESQKEITERQKKIVEQKNKEITDSITYAKRLQEAILPPREEISKYFSGSFIFYKPKDIVAGDFYWMHVPEKTKEHPETEILFAVADSTGHGVPGAMVSVVCSNALNRSVNEFKLKDPGKILDKTRELVLETFSYANEDVRDGMDISLVAIKGTSIRWAGANNPLWYIHEGKLEDISAHKQAIGKTDDASAFPTHMRELNKGDMIYLITDGFADQFGLAADAWTIIQEQNRQAPSLEAEVVPGKKFKYQALKQILLSIHTQSPNEQELKLSWAFEDWRRSLEQVDDITIVGLKV